MNLDWKRLFRFAFEGTTEVLGLDIGSSAVKIVKLCKDEAGYALTAAGMAEIPAGQADDDHPETNTVRAIRQCLGSTRLKTKSAVCGVSGPEVAVRNFQFPLLAPEETEGAVSFEASQVCPFNAGKSVVDHLLMSGDSDKTRGVLVAATNTLITSKIQLVKEANLKCVLMDVDGLALLNCFNELTNEDGKFQAGQTTAILNVGGSHTTLAIMSDDGWPFIRDMTYAGDDIIKQIATDNDMPTETVKEILFGDSSQRRPSPEQDSTAAQAKFHDTLEKACQKLVTGVDETLRYYATQAKSTPVDRIFVCGGFALAEGFVELLNSRLGAEATLWNPFDKMRCDADRQCKNTFSKTGPAMAVAVGLAMRSI